MSILDTGKKISKVTALGAGIVSLLTGSVTATKLAVAGALSRGGLSWVQKKTKGDLIKTLS